MQMASGDKAELGPRVIGLLQMCATGPSRNLGLGFAC